MNKVIRKKPDFEKLRKEGYTPVDMHSHTTCSDASCTTKQVITKAKKMGIGICISDHNEIHGALQLHKTKDVLSIPAIEVTSENAKDILLYFYNIEDLEDYYKKYVMSKKWSNIGFNLNRTKLSMKEIVDYSKDYDCVKIIPHPASKKPKLSYRFFLNSPKLLKSMDGAEVMNATQEVWRDLLAEKFARQVKLPFTGGSDAHNIEDIGRIVTAAKIDSNTCNKEEFIEEFLNAVKSGKTFVIGQENTFLERMKCHWTILRKNIWFSKRKMLRHIKKFDEKYNKNQAHPHTKAW